MSKIVNKLLFHSIKWFDDFFGSGLPVNALIIKLTWANPTRRDNRIRPNERRTKIPCSKLEIQDGSLLRKSTFFRVLHPSQGNQEDDGHSHRKIIRDFFSHETSFRIICRRITNLDPLTKLILILRRRC